LQGSWYKCGTNFKNTRLLQDKVAKSPDRKGSAACHRHETKGTAGLYDLAREMADKFEQKYTGYIWDGDYFDAVQAFCQAENL
jgi:hypothetical protein